MDHLITHPDQLWQLDRHDLVRRLRPLLRRGGSFATSSEQLARFEENLPGVCYELAREWDTEPTLDGQPVGFGDYLAARLQPRLRQLDQHQHPHLYDQHRRYRPEHEPLPLLEETDEQAPHLPAALTTPDFSDSVIDPPPLPPQRLPAAMDAAAIAAPSQAALQQTIDRFRDNPSISPYRLSRQLGYTTNDARRRPATSIHLQLTDLLHSQDDQPPTFKL